MIPYEAKIGFGVVELILLTLFLAKSGGKSSGFRVPGSELSEWQRELPNPEPGTRNSELKA
jgi:hypothetical protein